MRGKTISLLLFTSILFSAPTAAQSKKLSVGFIGALSGPAAPYGQAARNGFEMALEENSCQERIKVAYEDDQYDSKKAISAFSHLVNIEKVHALVGLSSKTGSAYAPLAERKKIPLFLWANAPAIAKGRKFVALSDETAEREGEKLAYEVAQKDWNSIAWITGHGEYHEAISNGVKKFRLPLYIQRHTKDGIRWQEHSLEKQ